MDCTAVGMKAADFWPVAVVALTVAVLVLPALLRKKSPAEQTEEDEEQARYLDELRKNEGQ